MKKIYTTFLAITAVSLAANTQQLPNVGFEGSWSDCTPWTSNDNTKTQGQNPEGWCISHVIGTNGTGAKVVGNKVDGYNSSTGIQLTQPETGMGSLKSNVPAYITLGTTWSTSKASIFPAKIGDSDGGTFGGMEFSNRPDALSFYYKRSRGTDKPDEKSSVIAYCWKGSWSQADVPGCITISSTPAKVTMVDRDRCVLGYDMTGTQGGAVTNNGGVLISKIEQYITTNQSEWTNATYEFEYKTSDTPEKINVIISAGDYFAGADAVGKDNELIIDDVKLLYFSRLSNLTINGTTVNGFNPDTYEYAIDAALPEASGIAYTLKGNSGSAKATITIDKDNNKATITVTNAQGADIDGNNTHTYTLNFKAAEEPVREGIKYDGSLSVQLGDGEPFSTEASVWIKQDEWPNATLSLYDFSLGDDMQIGDIIVDVICTGQDDGGLELNGEVKHLSLLDGMITANVTVNATQKNRKLEAKIDVIWLMEGTDEGETLPIYVIFNGTGDNLTGIESINADNSNEPVEYYNLQGMRVNAENLNNGIYIRRQGSETTKVFINK